MSIPDRHLRRLPRARDHRARVLILALAFAPLGLAAACGGSSPAPAADGAGAGGAAAGAEKPATGAGAEAVLAHYRSSRFRYQINAPGTMTEAADGTASSHSGAENLSITVVTGSAAGDPSGYATADIAKVKQSATNYREQTPLGAIKLSASSSAREVVYSATEGTSSVTGKANDVVVVRYYIPKDASTLAVLTYTVTASQYDPQGAADIANTFGWL